MALLATFGLTTFPFVVYSMPDSTHSLTTSSPKTMGITLIFAAIGVPLVLSYTASVYSFFAAKRGLDRTATECRAKTADISNHCRTNP